MMSSLVMAGNILIVTKIRFNYAALLSVLPSDSRVWIRGGLILCNVKLGYILSALLWIFFNILNGTENTQTQTHTQRFAFAP